MSVLHGEGAARTPANAVATERLNSITRMQIEHVIASPADRDEWRLLAEVAAPYGLNVVRLHIAPQARSVRTDDGKMAIVVDSSLVKENHKEVTDAWIAFAIAQIKTVQARHYDAHSADCNDARCPFRALFYAYSYAASTWRDAKNGGAVQNEGLDLLAELQRRNLLAAWLYLETFNAEVPAYRAWARAHRAGLLRLFAELLIRPAEQEARNP